MLLLFVILAQVSQHALGEEVVNKWVYEGVKSVLLPCTIPGGVGDITSVVWSRSDLVPQTIQQLGADNLVLNPHYSSRTSILADFFGFFDRDFSLTLDEPRLSDSGTFTCIVHSRVLGVMRRDVELQVTNLNNLIHLIINVFLVLVLLLMAALIVALRLWESAIFMSQVEVTDGDCLVELPHKTFVKLPEGTTVEWSRCTPELMKVHVSHMASSHPIEQHQIYQGRTSMKKGSWIFGPLLPTDLSLTLKDPCYRDRGTYICTVRREQEILVQKVVRLQVKVAQVDVETGDWSKTFKLPFVTTAQLPEDATVEWMRPEPINMTVHVFENGKDQPCKQDECYHGKTRMNSDPLRCRDLSVTVNNSGYSDGGIYICTVHREGHIFTQRKFRLLVKGLTCVNVEVDQMAKTVKLPWIIKANLPEDTSVEWSRRDVQFPHHKRRVHVFENGQDQPDQQDDSYQGRTTMRKNPLQSGDLSLTLKNPTICDNGGYVCNIRVNGESAWDKIVGLQVKGQYFR